MKIKKVLVINAVAVLGLGIFSSCQKEGCTDSSATNYNSEATKDDGSCQIAAAEPEPAPTPAATQPSGYSPTFAGSYGLLVGIKSLSTTTVGGIPINTSIGTAVATFSTDGGTTYLDAGTVSASTNNLTKQNNNSYVFTPGTTNPTGIAFGNSIDWAGTGATWAAFTTTTTIGFATVADITPGDASTTASYTITAPAITNADSVYFGVVGPNGTKYHVAVAGTTSHTFTAADVAAVGAGSGYVQVLGINYDPKNIGGKSYWIMNETVRTKSITIN